MARQCTSHDWLLHKRSWAGRLLPLVSFSGDCSAKGAVHYLVICTSLWLTPAFFAVHASTRRMCAATYRPEQSLTLVHRLVDNFHVVAIPPAAINVTAHSSGQPRTMILLRVRPSWHKSTSYHQFIRAIDFATLPSFPPRCRSAAPQLRITWYSGCTACRSSPCISPVVLSFKRHKRRQRDLAAFLSFQRQPLRRVAAGSRH